MGTPASVTVNPSSATNATSAATGRVDSGKTFSFGAPNLGAGVPTWLIVVGLLAAGWFLWQHRKA